MYYVPKRDAKNLMPIIQHNCTVGSEIVSDEWRAYRGLNSKGYKHYTVNHSKNFVDPHSKKHTQLIECLWNVAKSKIIKRSRGLKESKLPGYLGEVWLRSLHEEKEGQAVFESVLKLLKKHSYTEILNGINTKINAMEKSIAEYV